MMYIVAGGAGFIGRHLCSSLIASGNEVVCVDDFSSSSKDNLRTLLAEPRFTLLEHDISSPLRIDKPVEAIFHLASIASPKHYQSRPIHTLLANSMGTLNLLILAKKHNAKFLFASTSEVYGDPAVHPQPESYTGNVDAVGPRSCYDESKRFGEALVTSFNKEHKTDYSIARIFNTYGSGMCPDDARVIPEFVFNAIKGKNLRVYGSGSQTRSFLHIDDLLPALIKLINSGYSKPVNLGNPEEISILDLAKLIIKLAGSSSRIEFTDKMPQDPARRCPDIDLAKSLIGWSPNINLKQGLSSLIKQSSSVQTSK